MNRVRLIPLPSQHRGSGRSCSVGVAAAVGVSAYTKSTKYEHIKGDRKCTNKWSSSARRVVVAGVGNGPPHAGEKKVLRSKLTRVTLVMMVVFI